MEIRQVCYVLEVAKQGSFSKAANALFITQPAISQQINLLEEELQVKLFKRDTHSVKLTKDGEKFCIYGQEVVKALDNLMEAFHQSTTKDKTIINIGVFPFYKSVGLTSVINGFFAANHNVLGSIKVVENYSAYQMLESGELDFAIIKSRIENAVKPWVHYDTLYKEQLCALMSRKNPFAERKILQIEELGNFSLLTGEKDSHFYNEMKELYERYNINFDVAFMNTNEVEMMMEMVELDAGISLATETVGRDRENDKIVAIPIVPRQEVLTFLAYPKKKKLTGAYLALKNHIIEAYK